MLIAFEGLDGAGKTTQIEKLRSYFAEQIQEVFVTGPFLTAYGKVVRKVFMSIDNIEIRAQLYLLASAMGQLVHETVTALKRFDIVILDRYIYTTYAYHGGGLRVGVENISPIYEAVIQNLYPDLVILLDISPRSAYLRISQKQDRIEGKQDRIEGMPIEFYERTRQTYLDLAKNNALFAIVNAEASRDKVHSDIVQVIRDRTP